ncbi:jg9445 [Pararge aegeria aegeria]|uniref:Jg9445 protein n=1 Tax=Pararge aegeria aegeria TaxID=348720 RepID=A0A8S4SFI8_9NEOP|nr:jg9445 [Pararge aegeria aegeria]
MLWRCGAGHECWECHGPNFVPTSLYSKKSALKNVFRRGVFSTESYLKIGHSRRESDSIERLVVQGKVEGTRGRGRSPMLWTDQIKSAVGGPLHECTRLSASREKWRMLVGRVTFALKDAS